MKTAVTEDASAASEQQSNSQFLPTDEKYRLTGEMPADTREASAASTEEETETKDPAETEDASAASESDTAAASEAAETQRQQEAQRGKTQQTSESRWAKVTRENRELREKLARAEGKAEGQQRTVETQRDTTQASQPAADAKTGATPKPKIDDVDPKTKQPKYKTFAEYEDAKDAWLEDNAVRKFQETSQKTEQQRAREQEARSTAEKMVKKFEAARTKHADFDQVALNPDLIIPQGSVTDLFLLDSDHAGEVAYHLGQHPEVLDGFYGDHDLKTGRFTNKITPQRQFRALMEIEAKLSGTTAAADGKSGADKTSSSSARAVTQAHRPPNQTSGTGSTGKDAVEQAVEEQDQETYNRTANARELARLKRK